MDLPAGLARLEPYLDHLDQLSPEKLRQIKEMVRKYSAAKKQEECKDDYLEFVRNSWPGGKN